MERITETAILFEVCVIIIITIIVIIIVIIYRSSWIRTATDSQRYLHMSRKYVKLLLYYLR